MIKIHRIVECIGGQILPEVLFASKIDYSRTNTVIKLTWVGIIAEHVHDKIALASNINFSIDNGSVISKFTMNH
jgi:hypothetical protein